MFLENDITRCGVEWLEHAREIAHVVIAPEMREFHVDDSWIGEEILKVGEAAAEAAMPPDQKPVLLSITVGAPLPTSPRLVKPYAASL